MCPKASLVNTRVTLLCFQKEDAHVNLAYNVRELVPVFDRLTRRSPRIRILWTVQPHVNEAAFPPPESVTQATTTDNLKQSDEASKHSVIYNSLDEEEVNLNKDTSISQAKSLQKHKPTVRNNPTNASTSD